jgi:hypothetical protein
MRLSTSTKVTDTGSVTGNPVRRSGHVRAGNGEHRASHEASFGDRLIDAVVQRAYMPLMDGFLSARSVPVHDGPPVDFLFACGKDPKLPDEVFDRLLWGGLFIYADRDANRVRRIAQDYDGKRGFILETPATHMWTGRLGIRLPGFSTRVHYFAARKVNLIQPGQITERFTYHVELMPDPNAEHGHIVCKEVPTHADVAYRLRHRFPGASDNDIETRTSKLVDNVFPTFLTREAAILKILQDEMPEPYCHHVPKPMGVQKDGSGFVRRLAMSWLRTGGPKLTQIEFARQSAQLLSVLHNSANVMHLDLRLDNFVLTPRGVGFVDFGSSARIGEDIKQSPMLTSLFGEMMRTSKIQRMLGRMLKKGQVTNNSFTCVHQKADPAIDTFYLALQINKPAHNPQFAHLIDYDPDCIAAQAISSLTASVLRPKDQAEASFQSAEDVLRGIDRIRRRLIKDGDGCAK